MNFGGNISEVGIQTDYKGSGSGRCVDFRFLIGNRMNRLVLLQEVENGGIGSKGLSTCYGKLLPVGRSLEIAVDGGTGIFHFSIVSQFYGGRCQVY